MVFNKSDIATEAAVNRLLELNEGSVAVSARRGTGLQSLLEAVAEELSKGSVEVELLVPYADHDVVDRIYRLGEVTKRVDEAAGTRISARIPATEAPRFDAYMAD
jgi:GTP-binding protein HflX